MSTVIELITEIADDLYKGGEEMPSHVLMGKDAFNKMIKEMVSSARYSDANPTYVQEVQIMMSHGSMWIKQSKSVPANHVSIGGRTIDDIIAESILLGE